MAKSKTEITFGARIANGLVSLCFNAILFCIVVSFVLVVSVVGTRIVAPDWLRENIAERINSSVETVTIDFGDISVVVEDGLVPRLWLRDVTIKDETGIPIARLSDMQSAVALRPLLRGELFPSYVKLSGAQFKLLRADDGAVALSVGDVVAQVETAPDIAALVEQFDQILLHPSFEQLTEIEAQNVALQYEDARSGQVWTMDGGNMAFTRDGEDVRLRGDFVLLSGRDYATALEMNYTGRIGETASDVGLIFEDMPSRDIAGQSPALAWLSALDAPISGALRASVDDDGALGPLNATLSMGAGVLQPTPNAKPLAFDAAQSYFTYDPDAQRISFSEVSIESKWLSASAEGQATLVGAEDGWPDAIDVQFGVSTLSATHEDFYPEPVALEAANVDMLLQLDPFKVDLREFGIRDQGQDFRVTGQAAVEPEGWNVAVSGGMETIDPDRLLELWPERLVPKARQWVTQNIYTIDLRNINFSVTSLPKHRPDLLVGFEFSGFSSQFIKDFPIIEEAHGQATLRDNVFLVTGEGGHIQAPQGGKIDITGTQFEIPDVRAKPTPAKVHLKTSSTITAALSLIDQKPLGLMQKTALPPTLADGTAQLDGVLDLNLSKKLETKDIIFDVDGILQNVRSDALVKGRSLSAKKLTLNVTHETLNIGGDGLIGQVPFTGSFTTSLQADGKGSSAKGKIALSNLFLDEFKVGLPPGTVSGESRADVEIKFKKGQTPLFSLSSALDGLGLDIPQIGWSLPRSTKGSLEISGRLGEPVSIDSLVLNAAGLRASGSVSLRPGGQLNRAEFERVQIGQWIDAPLEFVGRGQGQAPLLRVLGGSLDLRETSLASGRAPSDRQANRKSAPIEAVLDQLYISDTIRLTKVRANLKTQNGLDGVFTGLVNGGAPIKGQIVPKDGRSAFRLQSDNAAAVLASAGLLQQARNGKLDISLLPGDKPGVYEGYLKATGNIRIKKAPTMAALLNAISVVGLLEQMGGEGIHFEVVEGRFQLSKDRLTLYSGSAVGASMGISMDGYYFPATGMVDMQGVVSPLFVLNGLGGVFTRRGEGLIGFNYAVKGPKENVKVRVNPLSALTPAMFRNLFRRAPPEPSTATRDSGGVAVPSSDGLNAGGTGSNQDDGLFSGQSAPDR
ncbi:MAG: DUF3971 domain-containing protein [Pseudomonadota bacterium]